MCIGQKVELPIKMNLAVAGIDILHKIPDVFESKVPTNWVVNVGFKLSKYQVIHAQLNLQIGGRQIMALKI